MGKSRTVDELGKTHFMIPINLRPPDSTGIFFSRTIVSFAMNNNTSIQATLLLTTRFAIFSQRQCQGQRLIRIAGPAVLPMPYFNILPR
jgi:hypothetical protein